MIRWLVAAVFLLGTGMGQAASAPDKAARTAALSQYQRDLVSVLVLRADATHLLGAALLARGLEDSIPGVDSASLLERATRADPDNPAIVWMHLSDCDAKAGSCPNAEALARLKELAPDNAAVWILALGTATRDGDQAARVASLEKAAQATGFNDYEGALLRALTLAATALPVPDAALRAYAGDAQSKAGPASAQAFLAYGQADMLPAPSFLPLMELCDPAAGTDTTQHADNCRKLAAVLAWGSSPQARAAGLHLQEALASSDAERNKAQAGMRDLTWQVRNYSHLALKALRDQTLARELLRLGWSGGSEVTRMSALMHFEGIPTRAPVEAEPATATSATGPANAASAPAPAAPTPEPVEPSTTSDDETAEPASGATTSIAESVEPAESITPATVNEPTVAASVNAQSDTPVEEVEPADPDATMSTPEPESAASVPAPASTSSTAAGEESVTPVPAAGSSIAEPGEPATLDEPAAAASTSSATDIPAAETEAADPAEAASTPEPEDGAFIPEPASATSTRHDGEADLPIPATASSAGDEPDTVDPAVDEADDTMPANADQPVEEPVFSTNFD